MSDEPRRTRRIVHSAQPREGPNMHRISVQLPSRTAGLLAYYAKTRKLTESMVVNQALSALLRGMRVSDPGAGAGEEVAEGQD